MSDTQPALHGRAKGGNIISLAVGSLPTKSQSRRAVLLFPPLHGSGPPAQEQQQMSQPPPESGSLNPVSAILDSIQAERSERERERRERDKSKREWEERVFRPGQLLRDRWNAEWSLVLTTLKSPDRNDAVEVAAGHLSQIGALVRELDGLNDTARTISPTMGDAAAATEALRPPTRAERLAAVVTDVWFLFPAPKLAAGLLSQAVGNASPEHLTELLRAVMSDADAMAAIGWFPFFRDRIFPPPGRQVAPGVYTCEEADPEGNCCVDDYRRAERYFNIWAYLREGEPLQLDRSREATCFVMGRFPPPDPEPFEEPSPEPNEQPVLPEIPVPPPPVVRQAKRPRGRKPTNKEQDNRLWDAWNTDQHADYAALATAFKIPLKEVRKAMDRERKRRKNPSEQ